MAVLLTPAAAAPSGPAHRVKGPVRSAWPQSGHAPRAAQSRWLARQVGPIAPLPCAQRWRQARRRCHLPSAPSPVAGSAPVAPAPVSTSPMTATAGDPGSPPGDVTPVVIRDPPSGAVAAAATSTVPAALKLVRSYTIPADDPAYNGLLNWSWTYDSALSAAAFASTGDRANSAQLLDQLSALQYTDGSIEVAFNTATGEGAAVTRTGTVAWVLLAAATYDAAFSSSQYLAMEKRSAEFLVGQQTSSGLVKGGPGVSWISTQHNLIAYVALTRLATELRASGATADAARYQASASKIAAAVNANLLISDGVGTHFAEGVDDAARALDVQALGAMYLQGTGQPALAAQVLAYAQTNFAVGNRTITTSAAVDTYNMTYAPPGIFSGYRPYGSANGPDVMWAEGSGQMRIAKAALGQDTSALDATIASWSAITGGGPLQSDRTMTSEAYGVAYHVWPASSAAAWTILAHAAPTFFAAPAPIPVATSVTTAVTAWTKVRGGNLIATFPDGHVDMVGAGGERRVLADPAGIADYTVTTNATLTSGAGYGVYVRASVDAGTKLTGYCVQVDHTYGQLVLREIQGDVELSVPLARASMPAGFTWYGVPHVLVVSVHGNAMQVSIDGTSMMDLPDLTAASVYAVSRTTGLTTTFVPPATGGYGLRGWSDAIVTLPQMTVTTGP